MMNGKVLIIYSILTSIAVHVLLALGVQHMLFSSAQIPIKSGNVSRELAIHVEFTEPQLSPEDVEKTKNITSLNEGETNIKEKSQTLVERPKANENTELVKEAAYLVMPDEEPVSKEILEEVVNKHEPELKTVSGRTSTQNPANHSGARTEEVIQYTEKVHNIIEDLNKSVVHKQASNNTSKGENGVLGHTKPGFINNPPPKYPRLARKMLYDGKVTLKVEVKADGSCGKVELVKSSGYYMLDNAATGAVKKWRFAPAKKWGKAVTTFTEITVNFQLD